MEYVFYLKVELGKKWKDVTAEYCQKIVKQKPIKHKTLMREFRKFREDNSHLVEDWQKYGTYFKQEKESFQS